MLITYLVTVYNKEKYIAHVIDSLKSIKGNFRKEFIIINDGSTDGSLAIIKKHAAALPKAIIIHQKNQGPALSINKGLGLATGDYVHFVDGDDIIAPDATAQLLKALQELDTEVAYGLRGKYDEQGSTTPSKRESDSTLLIENPIKSILEGKMPRVRSLGASGSLVSRSLLERVGGCDPRVFVQDLSLSLRCGKYSKFAYLPKTVCYEPIIYNDSHLSSSRKFERYNKLKAIARFIGDNEDIAAGLMPELNRCLWSTMRKESKWDPVIWCRYLVARYTDRRGTLDQLKKLYAECVDRLT
jgi:glycosyltransferase involved in cell wall biosynthesis